MSGSAPSLAGVIRAALRAAAADLRVALPARVERVDLAQGRLDAKPLLKDLVEAGAQPRTLALPVITNVPIVWPGAGGFRLTFPLAVGDTVLLVFSDRALDGWLERGGEVDPGDFRQHALSDAVAIPGLRPFSDPWTGAASDGATLGRDGGPWQPAALGQDVRDELDALWAALNNHGHLYTPGPGSPTPTAGAVVAAGTGVLPVSPTDKKVVTSGTVKISE